MPYTKEQVAEQLKVNDAWLFKGVLAIYAKQTASEQCAGQTQENNGVGFNGVDSPILSAFAEQIKTWNATAPARRRFNTPLSVKQTSIARRLMVKYSGQLAEIANANEARRLAQSAPPAPRHS